MLKDIVVKIENDFIKEAIASPKLLEDMALMEKYMAENYSKRILVELLQNADDVHSTKTEMLLVNNTLYFANNGRDFNEDDIIAICRSGHSSKKRGDTIGYRGIGFKSICGITNEVIVYSSDTYFTFSKKICAERLNKSEEDVPTVRIPFFMQENIKKEEKEII